MELMFGLTFPLLLLSFEYSAFSMSALPGRFSDEENIMIGVICEWVKTFKKKDMSMTIE